MVTRKCIANGRVFCRKCDASILPSNPAEYEQFCACNRVCSTDKAVLETAICIEEATWALV